MDYFAIKGKAANNQVEDTNKCAVRLTELEDELNSIRSSLSFKIKARERIDEQLRGAVKSVSEQAQGMSSMKETMSTVILMYSQAEAKIMSNAGDGSLMNNLIESGAVANASGEGNGWKPNPTISYKYKGSDGKLGKRPSIPNSKHGTYYDKETGKWKPLYDENGDKALRGWASEGVRVFGASKKRSESVYSETLGVFDVSAINTELKAGVSGGLYSANGKFAPGVKAELGACFSLLAIESEGVWGNDLAEAYAKGKLEVGTVGADASLTAALFSENGPELHATVSAEALAFKAEGHTGVTVLGTDIGVVAGASFGVGAHADVGYADGIFRAEVGATLGLGFNVGLEVDVSGTVDAVMDVASSAWDAISDWF